jgi:hypothetical protein
VGSRSRARLAGRRAGDRAYAPVFSSEQFIGICGLLTS